MTTALTPKIPSITSEQRAFFNENGYLVVENVLTPEEVNEYRVIYDKFLSGEIDCRKRRNDLGGHVEKKKMGVENVTQIMWPSEFMPELHAMIFHERGLALAGQLIGADADFDFEMMIDKFPHTDTPTPWHQDAASWFKLRDSRAATIWLALDEATIDNGCMWYVPGSHLKPLREHRLAGTSGGALVCDATESEAVAVPLKPGSGAFHHGATLHYSRGNSTDTHRRAFIINYRPKEMIDYERSQGFAHGRTENGVQNNEALNKR